VQTSSSRIESSPDKPTFGQNLNLLRTYYMKPSDLFSHPYEREVVSNTERDSEPVQFPAFSDSPQRDSTETTPPS
jgi:hypothetical protein